MKKNNIFIIIVLLILLIIISFFCIKKNNFILRIDDANRDYPQGQYKIEKEENIEDNKELLKIQFWEDTYKTNPEASIESISINLNIDFNKYKETTLKNYENDKSISDVDKIISTKLNTKLNNNWKYYIHWINEEEKTGNISFVYWVNDTIATNRSISCPIENGTITKIYYSYLNNKLDENILLYKYNYFINHYKQEKVVVDKYKDYYTIKDDVYYYTYFFGNNKLMYTYQIFYAYPNGMIDNDWGTEMYIEPKLIEDILKTEKIVIRDSNTHEIINSIIAKRTIREVAELLSRTLPVNKNEKLLDISIGSKWNLSLYDSNEELIDTLYIWNDGKLGFNNSRDEYLKENYKNSLIKIITQAN